MRKRLGVAGLIFLCGLSLGWLSGSVSFGTLASGEAAREEVEFEGQKFLQERRSVSVPPEYGALFAITPHKGDAALWFVKDDEVRNVVVSDAAVVVRRAGRVSSKGF